MTLTYILTDKAAGGDLYTYLRHQAKPYRKRYGKNDYRGTIPGRVDIDQRPQLIDDKIRLGDWEADTVIGKGHRGVLVTLTERVSKLNFAVSIIRKESELTKDAIQARHATSRNSGTPVAIIRSPTQRMGDALNALRPQRLRTKAASSLLPHWLDGYSECNSCSSRVLLAHVESANCPVAYQGLKITTSLSSVSMIFSD